MGCNLQYNVYWKPGYIIEKYSSFENSWDKLSTTIPPSLYYHLFSTMGNETGNYTHAFSFNVNPLGPTALLLQMKYNMSGFKLRSYQVYDEMGIQRVGEERKRKINEALTLQVNFTRLKPSTTYKFNIHTSCGQFWSKIK